MLMASSTQPAAERDPLEKVPLSAISRQVWRCILQCQGAASSIPQVFDGSAESQQQSREVGTTRVVQSFHSKRVRCAH